MGDFLNVPFLHLRFKIDDSYPHANPLPERADDVIDETSEPDIEFMSEVINALYDSDSSCDPTLLYRYYDTAGGLLYVGITNDFDRRDEQHFAKSAWRFNAAYARMELFPRRSLAEILEAHCIALEKPEYNVKTPRPDTLSHFRYGDYFERTNGVLDGEAVYWVNLCESVGFWERPKQRGVLGEGDGTPELLETARMERSEREMSAFMRRAKRRAERASGNP